MFLLVPACNAGELELARCVRARAAAAVVVAAVALALALDLAAALAPVLATAQIDTRGGTSSSISSILMLLLPVLLRLATAAAAAGAQNDFKRCSVRFLLLLGPCHPAVCLMLHGLFHTGVCQSFDRGRV